MSHSIKGYKPAGFRLVKCRKSKAYAFVGERSASCFIAHFYYAAQSKPWNAYRYPSERERNAAVAKHFAHCVAIEAAKAERAAQAKVSASNAGLQVGRVFSSSWGYDQTNVNYYEVLKLVGSASAMVQEIHSSNLEGSEGINHSGQCIPSCEEGRFKGEPFLAKVVKNSAGGFSIRSAKIYGRCGASEWEGKPLYWSAYA